MNFVIMESRDVLVDILMDRVPILTNMKRIFCQK